MQNTPLTRPNSVGERRIAYVMEQTLGNVTHYLNMRAVAADMDERLSPRWVSIDYRSGKLPWTVTGGLLARRAVQPLLQQVDGLFVHTMTLALGLMDVLATKPVVVSCDATPYGKRHMREQYGLRPQRELGELLKRELYRRMLKRAVGFVAWSDWAKRSLVNDYGCRDQDVAVISPGIDLAAFAPGVREQRRPRILFVGGNFERKGGDLLLSVYREQLRDLADLVLVTRDEVSGGPGVTVLNDVSANSLQLRQLYASSDVFVLPTRADCYALACMEAMAAGLPVISTRVGGIPDMIAEGRTGHVIEVDDGKALATTLKRLCTEPTLRTEMGAAARESASLRFDAKKNALELFEFVRSRC